MAMLTLVLLFVSVAQAGVGDTYIYDFNNLTVSWPVNGQVDGEVTWLDVHPTHQNIVRVYSDPNDPNDKYGGINATNGEQLITSLTNYPTTTSIFNLSPTDTQLRLSYTGKMNRRAGWLVGIWIDGIDANANSATTNEVEHAVQFGMSYVDMAWRIRGAAGSPSVTDTTGIPTDPILDNDLMELTLYVDLLGNGGDGSMSLTVKNLLTSVETQPPALQNVGMNLLSVDPNHETYGDPSKWTGWYLRSQRLTGGDDPINSVGYHTIDNLTLEVIPEPATLSLLVLGGLACIRRRR